MNKSLIAQLVEQSVCTIGEMNLFSLSKSTIETRPLASLSEFRFQIQSEIVHEKRVQTLLHLKMIEKSMLIDRKISRSYDDQRNFYQQCFKG